MREVDEKILAEQIPEVEEVKQVEEENANPASQYIGTKLTHKIGGRADTDKEEDTNKSLSLIAPK